MITACTADMATETSPLHEYSDYFIIVSLMLIENIIFWLNNLRKLFKTERKSNL